MITFNNIVERFKLFAENHFFIETFSFGSPDDVDLTKFTHFPLMHLVYTGATYDPGTKTYNLEVYILDVPADKTKKVDRQKEVVSDAEQCAEDIIADIKNGGNIFLFAQDYEVVNATTTPLEEETKNVLSGVLLDLSVSIPYEWDACNAPIDGVSPEGGDEVAYARRGILRMLTQDGATDVLSVRTIKVNNGTLTDDGDGVVTLDTGGAESLNDLTDVTLSFPTTGHVIVYDRDASPRGFVNQTNSLANLTDTNITSTPNQSFLRYINGAWTAVPVSIPSPPPSTTDGLPEGSTNLYFTDQRVSDNSDVTSNTAKNSYPSADATKLAGIEEGAEVNVNADWNATSGDAQILNKPTIPTNTNVANTDLTLSGNKTFDHDGGTLTFDLNDGGQFIIKDSSDPSFGVNIETNSGTTAINGIFYPESDGTAGQAVVTDGNGQLSFADIAVDVQYHGRYDSEAETLLDGATDTVELYYTAQADGDGLHEDAQSDTPATGYDIRRKLYYAEKAQTDPNTSGDWTQFADIADDTTFASAKATLLAYLKERTGGTVPISLKMTWEQVAEAPAFTGLLNETYGSGAAAAYSVRRLNGLYTGSAIQVERSSDNTTQDIGFDSNGDLDESALTTFCTGTTCKVRTWYDQSQTGGTGSGNDAVQTTHANQPTIYTGGAIVKENERVAVDVALGDNLKIASISLNAYFSTSVVLNPDVADGFILEHSNNSNNTDGFYLHGSVGETFNLRRTVRDRYNSTSGWIGTNQTLITLNSDGTPTLHKDGTALSLTSVAVAGVANTSTSKVLNIFSRAGGSQFYNGKSQEIVIWNTDKSTDRTDIEENIGDYFTQNTPLLDTYTGAAAAYSLRKLSSSFSGSAIRVRRSNDNAETDIGFNVFGELDTVSLAAHCGSSDGFVKTWYCQSGNANDATQTNTANQPKIYDGTTGVVTESGKPALFPDGTGFFNTSFSVADGFTAVAVFNHNDESTQYIFGSESNILKPAFYFSGITLRIFAGALANIGIRSTSQALYSGIYDAAGSGNIVGRVNQTETVSATAVGYTPGTSIDIFASNGNGVAKHTAQEIIIWQSNQRSAGNISDIEDNINTFYDIY